MLWELDYVSTTRSLIIFADVCNNFYSVSGVDFFFANIIGIIIM